jgi:hypothetical protein
MLFTWDTTNLCVVFRWWHIRSTPGLLISLLAIVALAAGYEGLRSLSRRFERWAAMSQSDIPSMLFLPPLFPIYRRTCILVPASPSWESHKLRPHVPWSCY